MEGISPPNILVVDDVSANLTVLIEMIRNAGYIARPVTSVRHALSAMNTLTPNLILLDISMPEIDGYDFCSMLKKDANTRDIPVIFITALASKEDKIRGFQLGAVDYIVKPFEAEEVTMRINTHLKMYKMQQELEVYNKKLYKIINDQIGKLFEAQRSVLKALTRLCASRSKSIGEHLERVGMNSKLLAMSLQLSPIYRDQITNSFIDAIELAAQLHDIGKMAFHDEILSKSYDLDFYETDLVKLHTTKGAQLLEEIYAMNEHNDLLKMAIEIAKYHHENWDGTGYSMRLAGNDIPLSARIVSIVDNYDYNSCLKTNKSEGSHEASMKIINQGAGTLFDPDIVAVMNKIQYQLQN